MKAIVVQPNSLARTFTLNARYDTHRFLSEELPEFLESVEEGVVPLRMYFTSLRSGEYIPKASYADSETDYVYLTIGQFSGLYVSFEGLTFLEDSVGQEYKHIQVQKNDLVVTRSGTVGVVHVFDPPDDKIYVPSHHLAVVRVREDSSHSVTFLRLFLQSNFARRYFWAFASGKGQKEISNWSIKSIPIPQCSDPHQVASECEEIEARIIELEAKISKMRSQKEQVLIKAIEGSD